MGMIIVGGVQADFRLSDMKLLKQNHLRLSEHI